MKLKLFLISILVLILFVAYQKYAEYSSLKSIDSYGSCVAAKGSIIQESYPATCVTRLGSHFTQEKLQSNMVSSPSPAPSQTIITNAMKYPYQIGNFSWSIDQNYIYSDTITTVLTDPKLFDSDNGPCFRVGNIHVFYATKKLNNLKKEVSLSMNVYSWEQDNLKFIDSDTENIFKQKLKTFSNLNDYASRNLSLTDYKQPDINISNYIYCSGGFNFPLVVSKVDQNKFDEVYYLEIISGNSDLSLPDKSIVIHHKNNWLVYSEPNDIQRIPEDVIACNQKDSNTMAIDCIDRVWKSKYQDEVKTNVWINQILASFKFTN